MDIADIAAKVEAENLRIALERIKYNDVKKMGKSKNCLFCDSELEEGKVNFCNYDCKDDYDYEQSIKRNQGLINE